MASNEEMNKVAKVFKFHVTLRFIYATWIEDFSDNSSKMVLQQGFCDFDNLIFGAWRRWNEICGASNSKKFFEKRSLCKWKWKGLKVIF